MKSQFKPSGYTQSPLSPPPHAFTDYQQRCHNLISQVRTATNYCPQAHYVDQVTPYQLGPTDAKCGILLLHGLLETPFSLRDIGHHFADQGYLVRAILLPGHATIPGDLLTINDQTWQQACQYGISDLLQSVDQLYLCGYSTGALLALIAAYNIPPEQLKGLILFAPAIRIARYPPHLAQFINRIAKVIPRLHWLNKRVENDFARYHSLPWHAAHQVYRLSQELALLSQQQPLSSPLFVISSADDAVICHNSAIKYFCRHCHPNNRMIIYDHRSTPRIHQQILQISSDYPEQHIAHFSHICLATSPENPHYGEHGDYPMVLKNGRHRDHPRYGELYHANITHRLSYNPHFHPLMAMIDQFMAICSD